MCTKIVLHFHGSTAEQEQMAAFKDVERQGRSDFFYEDQEQDRGVQRESKRHRDFPQPVSLSLLLPQDFDGKENQEVTTVEDDGSILHLLQPTND